MKKNILLSVVIFTLVLFASCGDDDDSLQSFLTSNSWSYSGMDCSEFSDARFDSDGTGTVWLSSCNGSDCAFVTKFDWKVTENGTLTVTYDYESSASVNSCGLTENVSDVQSIDRSTRTLTLQNETFSRD